ncbi:hypothetical protein [Pseudoalteromonas xiamenensis]|uniref:Uncharacterized protein n=1 Tax=Pseudoalteromonas xiamenensis TaxID=882626 RepID=A0A975HKA4_9GAMM|nr:hypothetical protein [Pseudoalteromonas xiamenensis]QTH70823.1 hypothetical protein J5O05_13085 [Pseudoalteromonas xiamenensis]
MTWFRPLINLFTRSKPTQRNELPVHYFFNATGHILFSTCHTLDQPVPQSVADQFSQVSALLGGMMKVVTTTLNPHTGQYYSPFNYHALNQLIERSGRFIKTSHEVLTVPNSTLASPQYLGLTEVLLGFTLPDVHLPPIRSIVSSFANEAKRMALADNENDIRAAHILFICEYIGGIPLVSVQLFSIDNRLHKALLVDKAKSTSQVWQIEKDSYLFT